MWLEILKKEVGTKGISQVATELGVSRSTVYLIIHGKYRASTRKVEERIMKIYGTKTGAIDCPVLGSISPAECVKRWSLAKKIGVRASNPETIKLYKTCINCAIRRV
ncbi:helix-turn-helix transcriptional regulator [Thermodesulfovibrio sp.]|uniref:helix-turn-helix domain-containing protein n=1 Tax=Thermodesulfovibrio sp. TaxID=2067987 RepID=UPI0030B11BAD